MTTVKPAVEPTISPWFVAMNGAVKSVSLVGAYSTSPPICVNSRCVTVPSSCGSRAWPAVSSAFCSAPCEPIAVVTRAERRREDRITDAGDRRLVGREVEHRPEVARGGVRVIDGRQAGDQHAVGALRQAARVGCWVTSTEVPGSIGRYCAVIVRPLTS